MKCGIEIHQRLSGGKLFCRCGPDAGNGQKEEFVRRLHAVKSELGELDAAAGLEASRSRHFRYSAPRGSCCLIEADEEPPHPMNPDALASALLVCNLLGSQAVDELHVMRKTVIDGSNTSGFQRTALLGTGGSILTPSGTLAIQTVCIEEESAGILAEKEGAAAYDLSRLGIPLVEIATAPDLKSGTEAQEAALAIGTLLRRTGLVQRGIGTIRQDLNVSIPEGARVEIKGVQELSTVAATVELEVKRQQALLQLNAELASRKAPPAEEKFVDLTSIFAETASTTVSRLLRNGARAYGVLLPGLSGLLGRELSPGRRFGTELADYARSAGVGGLIHSDENMEKYGFSDDEISEVRVALSLAPSDAFAIAVASEKKAQAALSQVAFRANFRGVPEETRKANPDGTSSYMRPLPGRARLYPETDLPKIEITKDMLSSAAGAAKKLAKQEEKKTELLSQLNPELASQLSAARGLLSHSLSHKLSAATQELSTFSAAVEAGTDAKFAASTITNTLSGLKREGTDTMQLDEPRLLSAFAAVEKGIFAKAAMPEVLREMCLNGSVSPQEAAKKLSLEKITGKALAKLIADEKLDLKGLMAKYRLRVDASEAQALLKKK